MKCWRSQFPTAALYVILFITLCCSTTCRNCKNSHRYEHCWTSNISLHCWLYPLGTINCNRCVCLILSHSQFAAGEWCQKYKIHQHIWSMISLISLSLRSVLSMWGLAHGGTLSLFPRHNFNLWLCSHIVRLCKY
jgi:hypothetical protein